MITREQAAQARAAAVRARADRPSQRRCAADPTSSARITHAARIELRDLSGTGRLQMRACESVPAWVIAPI